MKTSIAKYFLLTALFSILISCDKQDYCECQPCISANLMNNCVAYYPFNSNAKDESGYNNNGIVIGATLCEDRHGNQNRAYKFDGRNDYIEVKANDILRNIGSPFSSWSFSAYIKAFDTPINSEYTILSNYYSESGNDPTFSVFLQENTKGGFSSYIRKASIDIGTTTSFDIIDNEFHHIVVIYDSEKTLTQLYFDNTLVDQKTFDNSGDYSSNNNYHIGAHFWAGRISGNFKGVIDEVRIFNRALTVNEIKLLYNE
ncbi:LamG domain-containing protein [Saccharicrinis sp. FJH2]|uniref:LamG domain-containing protein n=1 Tax=Saccharicrinis sp. FJH65 TaxID=3344659 RepID=UPI0035F2D4F4